jgi:hypothetical protein
VTNISWQLLTATKGAVSLQIQNKQIARRMLGDLSGPDGIRTRDLGLDRAAC